MYICIYTSVNTNTMQLFVEIRSEIRSESGFGPCGALGLPCCQGATFHATLRVWYNIMMVYYSMVQYSSIV